MDQGQIVEQGSHEELLAINGIYANLWRVQSGDRPNSMN
jgi:ATP-binding cassette subfamily B protein